MYQQPDIAVAVSFADAYDRAVRVDATVDTYHEMLVRARESYLTRVSNELTATANQLLVFTVMLMVPLLVTGWYAMRFPRIPELDFAIGWWWPLGLILGGDAALLAYLRRRGWV